MNTRRLAITTAVVGFFAFAILGWFCGHSLEVMAIRAGVGMVALYAIVIVANRIVIGVVADAIVKNVPEPPTTRDGSGGAAE